VPRTVGDRHWHLLLDIDRSLPQRPPGIQRPTNQLIDQTIVNYHLNDAVLGIKQLAYSRSYNRCHRYYYLALPRPSSYKPLGWNCYNEQRPLQAMHRDSLIALEW
jgi:hypothetical protein